MYLLYLDDSGSAENKGDGHFVFGGICLEESRAYSINERLDQIVQEVCRDFGDASIDPGELELHATDILNGRKDWSFLKPLNYLERRKIVERVLSVLAEQAGETVAFAFVADKANYQEPSVIPSEAFEDIVSRFDIFLRRKYREEQKRIKGMILLDRGGDERLLYKLSVTFRTVGTKWRDKITNIVDNPVFVDSKHSRLMQLADHVAHATYRRYERQDTSLFDLIVHKFDADRSTIHGLKHAHNKPSCYCPACISRT